MLKTTLEKAGEEKDIKVSVREQKCLEVLANYFDNFDEGNCIYFRTIVKKTELTLQQVRRSVRALARKGLAEYHRGLFDDDGFVAGSGYCATEKGFNFIEHFSKVKQKQKEYLNK